MISKPLPQKAKLPPPWSNRCTRQPFVRRLEMFVTVAATYADTPSHGRRVLGIDSRAERGAFPVDMSFNLGVRFKTDYGLVSFSLVNVFDLLGR